jgi:hypothetical protein
MATVTGTIARPSSGAGCWYPRKILRTAGWQAFIVDNATMKGTIWINSASVVGCGGSGITITDASSTITILN